MEVLDVDREQTTPGQHGLIMPANRHLLQQSLDIEVGRFQEQLRIIQR
jgi:hypothetical protein